MIIKFIHFGKKINDEDLIIRITGDNLLVDKYLFNELINFYKKNNYDLLSIDRKKSKLQIGIKHEFTLLLNWNI